MYLRSPESGAIGFVLLLTAVFIILKLLGEITWSWWWVLSPVWVVATIVFATVLAFGAMYISLHWNKRL